MKNIAIFSLVTVFAVALFIAPNTSSAQTVADLQAQIQALLAQVQKLQAQLAQMQGIPAAWCHTFNTNLRIGDKGDDVNALTSVLVKEGLMSERSSNFSYIFDETTASAITGFQEKYRSEILDPIGLKYGTGYVGTRTRAKLNALYGCGVVAPPPVACTMDAKLCPDGSYVSRVAPSCEFAACPVATTTQLFISSISPSSGPIGTTIVFSGTGFMAHDTLVWMVKGTQKGLLWGGSPVSNLGNQYIQATLTAKLCQQYTGGSGLQCSSWMDITPGVYEVYIENQYGKSNSVNFTVTTTTQPSITVLSPNGGEQWAKGSTQTIRWSTTKNISRVSILLVPVNSVYSGIDVRTLAADVANTGSYSWTIPNCTADNPCSSNFEISTGSYYMRVVDPSNVGDDSDAPFSIVSATQPSIPVISLDPSTPSSQNITVGSVNVDMTHIRFSAVDRPVTITELWVGGNGFANDVSYIGLYDGGTLLQRQPVYGSSGSGQAIMVRFYDSNGLLTIPAYSNKIISIKTDISQNAQAGHTLALGITSGRTADSQFTASVMGNAMTITSSAQPLVTIISPSGYGVQWETEKTHTISWQSANAPFDAWVGNIHLYKGSQFLIGIVPSFSYSPPSGSVQYTVPAGSVTGNDFQIHVILYKGAQGSGATVISEAWSAPFSIVAAAQSTPVVTGGLCTRLSSAYGDTFVDVDGGSISIGGTGYVVYGSQGVTAGANQTVNFYAYVPDGGSTGYVGTAVAGSPENSNFQSKGVKIASVASGANPTNLTSQFGGVIQSITSYAPGCSNYTRPSPSVTVLSPNGGETWQQGSRQKITWQAPSSIPNVYITLHSTQLRWGGEGAGGYIPVFSTVIASSTANTGAYDWVVPASIPQGSYKVNVQAYSPDVRNFISDDSDAPFSIVAAGGVGQSAPLTQLANTLESVRALLEELSRLIR